LWQTRFTIWDYRLALSATPERWFDPAGTAALRQYFGATVFQFSLSDAIGTCLTPYYYFPVPVELTTDEMSEYKEISSKIGRQLAICQSLDDDRLGMLLIKRANILNNAQSKLPALANILRKDLSVQHSLFYCSPGNIDAVAIELAFGLRLRVHRFTAVEPPKIREKILREFSSGELQGLVAMKCLDEGVDVPATRTAYILASSSNPREFIQRRGRVLRKFPGKFHASIYDFITIPPNDLDEVQRFSERAILRRELRRFAEFADSAMNTMAAYEVIWDIASKYDVLDFKGGVDYEHA
jgi:superfamily II DNA or RNA helicase